MDPFDALHGNEQLKTFFRRQIEKKSLSHVYILEGEEGTGRHTTALAAAQALAGDTPEGRKIARGVSPDVKIFAPQTDKKQLGVDVIRELREDAFLLPNDLPFKVYLIEKAETMNTAAQNAALKILEEPPANTYFFLLCDGSASLLPTIRSRAPTLRMQRFSPEELDGFFAKDPELARVRESDGDYYRSCLRQFGGSYGKTRDALLSPGSRESKKLACELLSFADKYEELLIRSALLPKKRQECEEVFLQMQYALRDIFACRAGAEEDLLLFFSGREEAQTYLRSFSREQITALIDLTEELISLLNRNVNLQNLRFAFLTGVRAALSK